MTATACLALVVRAALPPGVGDPRLPPGVYFGWVGDSVSRFQVVGSPCEDGDELLQVELSEAIVGGQALTRRLLTGAGVSSDVAEVDLGRALPVVRFETAALHILTDAVVEQGADPTPIADEREGAGVPYSFTHLKAVCRSWRETSARVGSAAVMPLSRVEVGVQSPLEAHVVPLPDKTAVVALLLLWNRSAQTVTVDTLWYAPEVATTGEVLVVNGTFEQYREMEAAILAAPASLEAASSQLDLRIVPGGVALVGLSRTSFAVDPAASVLLSYPVLAYESAGNEHRLAMKTPLYSEALGGPKPRFGAPR